MPQNPKKNTTSSKRREMVMRALNLDDGPKIGGLEDRLSERYKETARRLAEIRARGTGRFEGEQT